MDSIRQYLDQSEDDECEKMSCDQTSNQTRDQVSDQTSHQAKDQTSNQLNNHVAVDNRINNQVMCKDVKTETDDESIVKELLYELISKVSIKKVNRRAIKNENEIQISSDEESSSDESNSETDYDDDDSLDKCSTRFKPLKTKGELLIEELPAPDDEPIQLTCGINELQQIGNVNKILDNILIVESFKNLPALDLDSLLFFRTGRSIGKVFDVIGPVIKPFYVIRFATNQQILDRSITINMPVYFVPKFDGLTKYVLVSQLKEVKGSDASWENNNEPPENVKEYSDDEEERKDKLKMKAKRRPPPNHNSFHKNKNFNNRKGHKDHNFEFRSVKQPKV